MNTFPSGRWSEGRESPSEYQGVVTRSPRRGTIRRDEVRTSFHWATVKRRKVSIHCPVAAPTDLEGARRRHKTSLGTEKWRRVTPDHFKTQLPKGIADDCGKDDRQHHVRRKKKRAVLDQVARKHVMLGRCQVDVAAILGKAATVPQIHPRI